MARPTDTPTVAGTTTPTSGLNATATAPAGCPGDCGANGTVSVDELVLGVSIALEHQTLEHCTAFDTDHDSRVTVDELVAAVHAALGGCFAAARSG